ncbi:MAG: amidase [Alphaproteobacteria bacterium]
MKTGIINDELGAFCSHLPPVYVEGAASGPLHNTSFGAKDLYAVKGHKTGAGNPDWLRTHEAETENAHSVQLLLDAGADLAGKTHTDELAFSLNGENHHYGTPINPAAEGRIPGGSSSGSASAVAGGLVDFALGSDTGGSVRVPASYCGIYGIRPTQDRINSVGVMPLAPTYDVVGWFARDSGLFAKVGDVLMTQPDSKKLNITTIKLIDEMFEEVSPEHKNTMLQALDRIAGEMGLTVEHIKMFDKALGTDDLETCATTYRFIQVSDIWKTQGAWISEHKPEFGPGLKERFEWAAQSPNEAHKLPAANALREKVRALSQSFCDESSVLAFPTSAGVAPLRADTLTAMDEFRQHALRLTCLGGLNGFPQVSIPGLLMQNLPIGLSFMSAANTDKQLLKFIESVGNKHILG